MIRAKAGKTHCMIKRKKKQISNLHSTTNLFKVDADNVKKFFLTNG